MYERIKKKEKKMEENVKRIYVKRLVCTYMNLEELSLKEIKNHLFENNLNIKEYLISKDFTKEMKIHYHVYLKFDDRQNVSPKNLSINESMPKYERARNYKYWINYLLKKDSYLTNISKELLLICKNLKIKKEIESEETMKKEKFNLSRKLKEIVDETNCVEDAMNYFSENYPELVLTKFKSFKSNLEEYLKR